MIDRSEGKIIFEERLRRPAEMPSIPGETEGLREAIASANSESDIETKSNLTGTGA